MFIDVIQNNGKPYLRLVNSIRVENKVGKKIAQKKVLHYIGPLDKFDDGKPEYIERLRQSFRAGAPLIPSLAPYCTNESPREKYTITFEEGSPECVGSPKLYVHKFLERIFEELGMRDFFSSYKGFTKIEYDVYGFAKLLVFGRLLNPASKIATTRQNDDYYEPMLTDFNPDNVYDTLDFIAEHKDKIIRRINTQFVKKGNRRPEIIYYDVTNFYLEIEDPDDDILDEDGNVLQKGLRKKGVSKEERKLPIVQMGLFMDDNGIPISIEQFPGNTLDHLTVKDALKNSIDDAGFSRFILIGDRGICTYQNLLHVTDAGNGYIVAKSLLKSKAEDRNWAYSNDGYINVGEDFKYKSRIVTRTAKDEYGIERTFSEKVVVYWSRKFADRQLKDNKSFLDFIKKLLESPHNFRVSKTHAKSIRNYLRKDVVNEKTGEVLNSDDLKAMIDTEKLDKFLATMGYYQIVTSELTMDTKEVIDKYHGLSQIEDQFRAMKGALDTRPLYVRNPEHIKAHLVICTIALIMMRIIQNRIVASGLAPTAVEKHVNWTHGLSLDRVQNALKKWKVDKMPGDLYRFNDIEDPDLKLILDAFNINIPLKFFRRSDLKAIKTATEIFI
jgi:transposase